MSLIPSRFIFSVPRVFPERPPIRAPTPPNAKPPTAAPPIWLILDVLVITHPSSKTSQDISFSGSWMLDAMLPPDCKATQIRMLVESTAIPVTPSAPTKMCVAVKLAFSRK